MDKQADGHLDPDLCKHLRDKDEAKKTLDSLEGFKILSDFDRNLLLGCWKQEDDPKSVTAKVSATGINASDFSN